MNDASTQQLWQQLTNELTCAGCKAARFLIWDSANYTERPTHSVTATVDDQRYFYAVHCDYFKRRVEKPDHLLRCEARQERQ